MDRFKMLVKKSEILLIKQKVMRIREEVVDFSEEVAKRTTKIDEIEQKLSNMVNYLNLMLESNDERYEGDDAVFAWCEITFGREYVYGKRRLIYKSPLKDILVQLGIVRDELNALAVSMNEKKFLDIAREANELISYVLIVTNPIYQQLQ